MTLFFFFFFQIGGILWVFRLLVIKLSALGFQCETRTSFFGFLGIRVGGDLLCDLSLGFNALRAVEIHDHQRSMDPSPAPTTPPVEEDEWDTDGFVIPSLEIGDPDQHRHDVSEVEASKPPSPKAKKEENIYLGPHGAPPSQSKQQELNSAGRKQKFKQKLKEADRRTSGTGRENKLESLRELVGGGKSTANVKGSSRDWLDPHCHESQFEKRNTQ